MSVCVCVFYKKKKAEENHNTVFVSSIHHHVIVINSTGTRSCNDLVDSLISIQGITINWSGATDWTDRYETDDDQLMGAKTQRCYVEFFLDVVSDDILFDHFWTPSLDSEHPKS